MNYTGWGGQQYGRTTYLYDVAADEWRITTTYPESTSNGLSVPYGDTFVTMGGNDAGDEVYWYVPDDVMGDV